MVPVATNTYLFPPKTSTPAVAVRPSGNHLLVTWPSASAGWSLQQNPVLNASRWPPGGYKGWPVADDGTNKRLIITPVTPNLFFRLMHP